MTMLSKALKEGTVIHGEKYDYRVLHLIAVDGQGYTYKTMATDIHCPEVTEFPMVVREQMMSRCSDRGPDGMSVVYNEDVAPTVESCRESFIFASKERQKISQASKWLVNVMETFPANNTYYYAVEFLAGESLADYIKRMGGRLTLEQTRDVLSPIFDGVRTMHRFQTLHTHINPKNIRFRLGSNQKVPVLYNLYSSIHFSDESQQYWTLPNMNCEPGFAPPEQYGEITHFEPQVDIFALAATIVYALSGTPLPDSRQLKADMVREMIPSDIPDYVVTAILNALYPDLSKRTGTVTKFREELDLFYSEIKGNQVKARRKREDMENDAAEGRSLWQRLLSLLRG